MGSRHKHLDMRTEMGGGWGGVHRKAIDPMSGSQGDFKEVVSQVKKLHVSQASNISITE